MLDLRLIREQTDEVRRRLATLHTDTPLDEILALDERHRALLAEVEELRAARNAGSKEVSKLRDPEERNGRIAAMRELGDRIAALEAELTALRARLDAALLELPNLPDPDVPLGRDELENVVVRHWGSRAGSPSPPAALGPDDRARHPRHRARREGLRLALLSPQRARREAAARDHRLDARPARRAARLHRDLPALPGPHRGPGRHRPVAEVRRRAVPRRAVGSLADPDRRGPGDQHAPRGDSRPRHAAAGLRRLLGLLPPRAVLGRARRAASSAATSSTRSRWSASPSRSAATPR